MGQAQSAGPPLSIDELSHRLTEVFATKCLTPLELYIFKAVFKAHATTTSGLTHWPQSTVAKFLGLPEHAGLNVTPVIFQLSTYVGAFPFPSLAPAILTNEALLRVIVVLTGRHSKVLRGGRNMWEREIWRALAIFDRAMEPTENPETLTTGEAGSSNNKGFAIDEARNDRGEADDDDDEDDEDDEMLLAAFEAMDAADIFKHGEKSNIQHAMIPSDNFLTLIVFLLLISPLGPQERLEIYTSELDDDMLQELRQTAHCILASFGVEKNPGISYKVFRRVVSNTLPHLFHPLKSLFEHFFFPPDFDLHKRRKESTSSITAPEPSFPPPLPKTSDKPPVPLKPIMPDGPGDILTRPMLSHLATILPPSILFRNLTRLYSGNEDGFSMPTFQDHVFNWRSPTIILLSGTLVLPRPTSNVPAPARAFLSSVPRGGGSGRGSSRSRQLGPSTTASQRIVYGAFVPVPWKQTHRSGFGTADTLLFQLSPQHDVFRASGRRHVDGSTNSANSASTYAYFNRQPSTHTGLGFGSPIPDTNIHSSSSGGGGGKLPLGPVSLHVDDSLTYAVFTHDSQGGGSFLPSTLPASCRLAPSLKSETKNGPVSPSSAATSTTDATKAATTTTAAAVSRSPETLRDWQDVFEIDSLEVYGIGGEDVLEEQKRARQWEEREAERRRGVQLRVGDTDSERELLKMAGLIGEGRSGGSMS